jgi:hypothetical protein
LRARVGASKICLTDPDAAFGEADAAAVVPGDEPEAQLLAAGSPAGDPAVFGDVADPNLVFEDAFGGVVLDDE